MTESTPNPVLYCPRCDRKVRVPESAERTKARLDQHIKKAHPDYYENLWRE